MSARKSLAIAFAVASGAAGLTDSAAQAQNFGGLHFGLSAGGVTGSQAQQGGIFFLPSSSGSTTSTFTSTFASTIPGDGSYRIGGAAIGGGVGYDWAFDRAVLGIDTDLSWVGASGSGWCSVYSTVAHACGGGITALGTVRARAGYDFGSVGGLWPVLGYVTGGLAVGSLKGWDSLFGGSGSKTVAGWTIGAGLEALIVPNWSVKLEYLHVDLGNRGVFYATPVMERLKTTAEVFRVGVSYRFGAPPAPVRAKY